MTSRKLRWAAPAAAVAMLLTGCAAGQLTQTAGQAASSGGVSGGIGSMIFRDALIVFSGPVPGGAVYLPGQDAPIQVTIVNDVTDRFPDVAVDRLVAVSSPIAASGRIVGDTRIADGQVLAAGYDNPVAAVPLPGTTRVEIALVGLTEPIRAGLTYPVDFTFERAGTIRLQLPVEYADVLPPRAFDDELPSEDRTLETGPEVGPEAGSEPG